MRKHIVYIAFFLTVLMISLGLNSMIFDVKRPDLNKDIGHIILSMEFKEMVIRTVDENMSPSMECLSYEAGIIAPVGYLTGHEKSLTLYFSVSGGDFVVEIYSFDGYSPAEFSSALLMLENATGIKPSYSTVYNVAALIYMDTNTPVVKDLLYNDILFKNIEKFITEVISGDKEITDEVYSGKINKKVLSEKTFKDVSSLLYSNIENSQAAFLIDYGSPKDYIKYCKMYCIITENRDSLTLSYGLCNPKYGKDFGTSNYGNIGLLSVTITGNKFLMRVSGYNDSSEYQIVKQFSEMVKIR